MTENFAACLSQIYKKNYRAYDNELKLKLKNTKTISYP